MCVLAPCNSYSCKITCADGEGREATSPPQTSEIMRRQIMDDSDTEMKRSNQNAKRWGGGGGGVGRATERDLCPARLAMCVHALARSACLFQHDE